MIQGIESFWLNWFLNWYWALTLFRCRRFRGSHGGGSGASALQLPHGDAQESRDSHPGRQEVHGHRERRRTADPLPGCHTETWNDASLQLCSAACSVRGPPQRHGEAPVLPRLWLLLQGCEYSCTLIMSHCNVCGLTGGYCQKQGLRRAFSGLYFVCFGPIQFMSL